MNSTPQPLDPSSKRWLAVLAAVLLVFLLTMVHGFLHLRTPLHPSASIKPPPPPPRPVYQPAVEIVPTPVPLTAEQKAVIHKEMVATQAKYLRELVAKYPKTASLPKPEQIDEMEKKGELVW